MAHGLIATTSHPVPPPAPTDMVTLRKSRGPRSLRMREIDLIEEERRRVARDLHDEAGHRLTAAVLHLDAVAKERGHDAELGTRLQAARHLIQECAAGLHEVAFNLRPCILGDLGVVPAVRSLARRAEEATNISIAVDVRGASRRLPEGTELAAFRIVQEALTNALKYAQASHIVVRVTFSDEAVWLEIADDGVGFDATRQGAD